MQKILNTHIQNIVERQMKMKKESQILIFDEKCELSQMIAECYKAAMPNAQHICFEKTDPQKIVEMLFALPENSSVVLVQSSDFRLDNFRIRLNLFNRGIGCLEHTHLQYIPKNQYETYISAMEYKSPYYADLGNFLLKNLENATETKIFSKNGSVLAFGKMEEGKLNDGNFFSQKNRGGGAICGEVFSEAIDFGSVNGEISICCYPAENLTIVQCEPFVLKIEKSFVSCIDPKCPDDFRKNILEKIAASENNEVMVREAGFGLNPNISFQNPLADVNACERMAGFHLSLGKKHGVYRKKFSNDVVQRFHIDVFADLEKIVMGETVVFENGKYLFVDQDS